MDHGFACFSCFFMFVYTGYFTLPILFICFFFHIGRGRRDPKELQARDVGAAQTRHVAVVQLCRFPGKAHARGKAASIEKRSANDAAKYTEATL